MEGDKSCEHHESKSKDIEFINPVDEIVSEVNTFLKSAPNVVPPLGKPTNLVAALSFSLKDDVGCHGDAFSRVIDADGDLVSEKKDDRTLYIEYENATTIHLVGLQIWRGAFLLGDFIIENSHKYFKGKKVLEFGAGTGLAGIVASIFAQQVTLTDINDNSILELISANLLHNSNMVEADVKVIPLDFLNSEWSAELTSAIASTEVFLAADVVYHVDITSAFVRTLKRILTSDEFGNSSKNVFITMEKRYVFTTSDMETCSPMYTHFMDELELQLLLRPGSTVPCSNGKTLSMNFENIYLFPQYFCYEKCKELVLLHIIKS